MGLGTCNSTYTDHCAVGKKFPTVGSQRADGQERRVSTGIVLSTIGFAGQTQRETHVLHLFIFYGSRVESVGCPCTQLGPAPPSGLDSHVLPPGPPLELCHTSIHTSIHTIFDSAGENTMAKMVGWRPAHSPSVPFFRELLFGDCDLRLPARKFWPMDTPECQNPLNSNPSILAS